MTEPGIFFRTLLAQGPSDTVTRFANAFGISTKFVRDLDDHRRDWLEHRAKTLLHSRVLGDFTYFIEPWLWEFEEEAFQAILLSLSAHDLAIALPDDTSESPLVYVLFFDGERQVIDILDDEDPDTNFVWGNDPLRKRLHQIAAGN